ncbi:MAG: UTP--glucose-1-phosphate uridylyltransferase, partial [Clostridia bacterium]|nr:UTP--glucose-1-phosphate uridylyltransferase [Clostridia bacterium]
MKVQKAVILAAGSGTRFLPITKSLPKAMLTIVDKPAIQYVVEEIVEAGIRDILIVVSPGQEALRRYFTVGYDTQRLMRRGLTYQAEAIKKIDEISVGISFIEQPAPTGSAHAVLLAEEFAGGEPLAVLNADDVVYGDKPAIGELIESYEAENVSVVGVQEIAAEEVVKYAAIAYSEKQGDVYRVTDFIEKPTLQAAPSRIASLGRYIVTPEIFSEIRSLSVGANGEYQLTDALCALAKRGKLIARVFHGRRYDIGDKEGYAEAVYEYALRHPQIGQSFMEYLQK